ncbi:MAG: hypothetical protein U5L09_13550 [Bacteroidales bacterium]|nr:hypothetical protein [Bacteroidales bacterium]
MKYLTKFALLLIVILTAASCSNKFYEADEFKTLKRKHQTVAVLPATIDIVKGARKTATSDAKNASLDMAYTYQEIISEKLREKSDDYSVSLQKPETINQKLEDEYISYFNINKTDMKKIGNVLRNDALLYTEIETPILLAKNPGSDNKKKIKVKVMLHEANNEILLWSYTDEYKASKIYTIEAIAEEVMDNIGKKFPYKE